MVARDIDPSPFALILAALLERFPGARAAVLVDWEGEAVDYAGVEDPFTLRVMGAELGLIANLSTPNLGAFHQLVIGGRSRSFLLRRLPEGYLLALSLRKFSGFADAPRALEWATFALSAEAGWPHRPLEWFPIEVELEDARPKRVRGVDPRAAQALARSSETAKSRIVRAGNAHFTTLEILGAVAPPTRGFHVRSRNGWEATLVCEPGNHWYASEPS